MARVSKRWGWGGVILPCIGRVRAVHDCSFVLRVMERAKHRIKWSFIPQIQLLADDGLRLFLAIINANNQPINNITVPGSGTVFAWIS